MLNHEINIIFYKPEVKRCEVDHVASCDFTRTCTYPEGQISSLDHPSSYPERATCTWSIITHSRTFILLSFLEFDIPSLGQCDSSSVMIYNGDVETKEAAIDVFCNLWRPPSQLISAFNHLFIKFISGAVEPGTGFVAEYSQRRRDYSPDEVEQGGKDF